MNVLCIGNSFSYDANRYLYGIAHADKTDLTVVNLYIGGCQLVTHYKNAMADLKKYELCINGHASGFYVSIKEALVSRKWDYVTFQQGSVVSIDYSTYQPYLNELSSYVKKYAPEAKQLIHQTWAYGQGSELLHQKMGYADQKDMFDDVKNAYDLAFNDIKAEFILPSGELLQELIKNGVETVHRDAQHTSLGLGRYAMGLLWYTMLTGNDVENNTFRDFDVEITEEDVALAKKCVKIVAEKYKK